MHTGAGHSQTMAVDLTRQKLEPEGRGGGTKTLMALATPQGVLWSSLSQGEWKGASGKYGQMGHGAISRKAVTKSMKTLQ